MRPTLVGPRLLLRRLREVMAEPIGAQERLDKTVVLIASNMVAEVCSVYVLCSDDWLELFATEGLNRDAVHLTTMRVGEGLVGLIAGTAEPLALADAQSHPAFSYRPETGEEAYHSFLGVPILRGGNTLGVLVVQNRARRLYSEEEIEALQTVAMLLAEVISSGDLQSLAVPGKTMAMDRPIACKGRPIAEGIGLGYVLLHEPRVIIKQLVAEDVKDEERRLEKAIQEVRTYIDKLIDEGDETGPGEHREILEALRMFVYDRGWIRRLREAVMSGLTAEAAVERVQNDTRAKLQRNRDPYMRERLHDLDDLANRLLHQLTGQSFVIANEDLPDNAILVARNMGAAVLLDYDRRKLRGLVLEEGGASSHVAVVARALGIPAVGDIANITDFVETGDPIIVDGTSGEVQIRPQVDVQSAYAEKARLRARRQEQYRSLRDVASVTKDGVPIGLHMNAGLLIDLPHVAEMGADSIGLFRTELQFMVVPSFPRMNQQLAFYKSVLEAVPDRSVVFRTLDIGGDKVLPYMATLEEENPALGWRAIRIGLDRPALLRMQIRALLRAATGRQLKILFPMVACMEEFERAKALVEREKAYLTRHAYELPQRIELGIMVEVPSLLWQLDEVLERVDFLSVGSNDLFQYLYAADRDNKRVSGRFDVLSAPALRALKTIVDKAHKWNKPVTLCGEIGGRPLEVLALIALGYRGFSMAPAALGPVKAMILSLSVNQVTKFIEECLVTKGACASLRSDLQTFAEEHDIPL